MNKTTTISIDERVLEKTDDAVEKRLVPGVTNRSGFIEYALRRLFEDLEQKEA